MIINKKYNYKTKSSTATLMERKRKSSYDNSSLKSLLEALSSNIEVKVDTEELKNSPKLASPKLDKDSRSKITNINHKVLTSDIRANIWNNPGYLPEANKFVLIGIEIAMRMRISQVAEIIVEKLQIQKKHMACIIRFEQAHCYLLTINEKILKELSPTVAGRIRRISTTDISGNVSVFENMIKTHMSEELKKFNQPAYNALRLLKKGLKLNDHTILGNVAHYIATTTTQVVSQIVNQNMSRPEEEYSPRYIDDPIDLPPEKGHLVHIQPRNV